MEYSEEGQQLSVLPAGTADFEQVFKAHFKGLHSYAYTLLRDEIMAEEMVQNVFCKLWEKKEQIQITGSLTGYLYRSVHHECLNWLKHLKVRQAYRQHAVRQDQQDHSAAGLVEGKELQEKIHDALEDLPEQCRTIFQMSRFEDLKYREIADKMGLSVKTVENQMGKALKIMRTKLAEFLSVWLLLMINMIK